MKVLSCTSTAYPDGRVIKHQYGMPLPKLKCMDKVMKDAILDHINHKSIQLTQLLSLNRFKS